LATSSDISPADLWHGADLYRDVVRVCRLMYERGLIAATDGNVSARLAAGRILSTPSGLSKGFLAESDLVVTDMEGRPVPGEGPTNAFRPSAEIRLHLEVYRQRADVQAVVHAHPPITTALTVAGISLALCVLPETLVTLGTIATTAYATPTSAQGPQVVRELIGTHDALALDRHGAVTVGHSVLDAYGKMEKVENTALVLATAHQLGRVQLLPLDEIRRLTEMRRAHGGAGGPDCAACPARSSGECRGRAEER
jgi:L-fuculose-phosphate aldolase